MSTEGNHSVRGRLLFSLRETLLLVAIVALLLTLLYRQGVREGGNTGSRALYSVFSPIEYRYWRQIGPSGSGTGAIGSGQEWQPASGMEIFDRFVILHSSNGVDRMLDLEGLKYFDWRPARDLKPTQTARPQIEGAHDDAEH